MNAPFGLIGAGLLFWGQQSGLWPLAVPMALALEGSRFLERRWKVAREDFYRVGDISTLLFAALVVYLYLTRSMAQSLAGVLAWFPVCSFPLIAAQCFSDSRRLDLGALYWSERRRGPVDDDHSVEFSYPYLVVCILSAGWANIRTPLFYVAMSALGAWALWPARSRARPLWVWAGLVALAGLLGYAAAGSLTTLQATLEQAAVEAVSGIDETLFDPDQTRTAIGRLGRIQQSGEIVLRVKASGGERPPALMRAAGYDLYAGGLWFSQNSDSRLPARGEGGGVWELGAPAAKPGRVVVTAVWPKGEGLLLLPRNAFRVDGLGAARLSGGAFGALKATQAPGVVDYGVSYGGDSDRDGKPVPADLELPRREAATVNALARRLGLAGVEPGERVKTIERFFSDHFRYAVYQTISGPEPLEEFLERRRAGHCEYFATATVLLLRAAGIPARYVTGFSVLEYSRFERAYVVRQRHAHAWASAYVDGAWRDVDTTPASWAEIEGDRGSVFEPLGDVGSWVRLRFASFRSGLMESRKHGALAWTLFFALIAWIVWKSAGLLRASQRAAGGSPGPGAAPNGSDSEFYEIERLLARSGFERPPWEAFAGWVARIAPELRPEAVPRLHELARLHSRYRFDPKGLTAAERRRLETESRGWLADHSRP